MEIVFVLASVAACVLLFLWLFRSSDFKRARKMHGKSARQELAASQLPRRKLTDVEKDKLQAVMNLEREYCFLQGYEKGFGAIGEDVYVLRGAVARNTLETNSGPLHAYRTMGGIEVWFPFRAEGDIGEDNEAEVVFSDKAAIVVGLNGTFALERNYQVLEHPSKYFDIVRVLGG